MTSEEGWNTFEQSYSDFILEFAEVAQQMNAELFCVGTELEQFVNNRPDYWKQLIKKVKTIYKGKLTCAANWNEYKSTTFWDELGFIGIGAYFPLDDAKTPAFEACLKAWEMHKPTIKAYAEKHQKPILFTEFGYRSVDYAAKQPWVYSREMTTVNHEAQINTTKALFETFCKEPWFAGGFVWKWFHNHDNSGRLEDNQFTPQNKPVEAVIQSYYKTF